MPESHSLLAHHVIPQLSRAVRSARREQKIEGSTTRVGTESGERTAEPGEVATTIRHVHREAGGKPAVFNRVTGQCRNGELAHRCALTGGGNPVGVIIAEAGGKPAVFNRVSAIGTAEPVDRCRGRSFYLALCAALNSGHVSRRN